MYKVNLLPDEFIQPGVGFKKVQCVYLIVFFAALILVGYGIFLYQLNQAKTELARLQKKTVDIRPELERLESLRKQKTELEKAASDLEGIAGKKVTWSPVISEISSSIPADVYLTGLQLYYDRSVCHVPESEQQKPQKQSVRVPNMEETAKQTEKQGGDGIQAPTVTMPVPNAVAIQGESRSVLPVGVFVNRLLKEKYFTDVRIIDLHENQDKGTFAFSLTAPVSGGER